MSFVCQYDVELVKAIEKAIGHQLDKWELPEKEVLLQMGKV